MQAYCHYHGRQRPLGKKRGMPRTFGHKKGAENVVKITRAMKESGVKYLTLYAFPQKTGNVPKMKLMP